MGKSSIPVVVIGRRRRYWRFGFIPVSRSRQNLLCHHRQSSCWCPFHQLLHHANVRQSSCRPASSLSAMISNEQLLLERNVDENHRSGNDTIWYDTKATNATKNDYKYWQLFVRLHWLHSTYMEILRPVIPYLFFSKLCYYYYQRYKQRTKKTSATATEAAHGEQRRPTIIQTTTTTTTKEKRRKKERLRQGRW